MISRFARGLCHRDLNKTETEKSGRRTEELAEWQPITSCTLGIFHQWHPLDLNQKEFESKGWNLEKRLKKSFKKQCEINREIACSHVYYKALFRAVICQKLFLEEVYTLDR